MFLIIIPRSQALPGQRGIFYGTTEKMVEWKSVQDSSTHSSPLRDDSFGRNDTQNCHSDERFLRGEIFRETPGMPIKMQRTRDHAGEANPSGLAYITP